MTYFDELELDTLPEYNYARELAKAAANWRNYVKPKEEIEELTGLPLPIIEEYLKKSVNIGRLTVLKFYTNCFPCVAYLAYKSSYCRDAYR